jgi:hypothetical protein
MTQEEDRRRAQHFLELAKATTDPALSNTFQMLAADYLELAEKAKESDPVQRQQPPKQKEA